MIPDVQLSKREKEVLKLVLQGRSNKQIAWSLGIAVRTVEFHLKNIYTKFQVNSRIELFLKLGQAPGASRKSKNWGIPQLIKGGKKPKMETGSIRSWIGPDLKGLSLLSVRS